MNISSSTYSNNDYKVIKLAKEYDNYTGEEKYAIITDLSEEELNLRYKDELEKYRPFVILSQEMYSVILESNRNDEREHKRAYRCHDAFAIDDERAALEANSDPAIIAESDDTYNHIINEMMKLPGRQGQRLYQHYVLGFSIDEIAASEGITAASVYESLSRAKKAMHKVFVESGVIEE